MKITDLLQKQSIQLQAHPTTKDIAINSPTGRINGCKR